MLKPNFSHSMSGFWELKLPTLGYLAPKIFPWFYSGISLIPTPLFRIPRYFKLKTISLWLAFESFSVCYFEVPLFRSIFCSPKELEVERFNGNFLIVCSTVHCWWVLWSVCVGGMDGWGWWRCTDWLRKTALGPRQETRHGNSTELCKRFGF